ncbi:glycoside hydrolase family 3 C-terminal domain-containing protein [Sphingomonas sp. ASV193]|uniref:glycoside hydrolase family 3 C-terminal domain-containing protein n=1 Tax=Sphingomonas sp. ASV193 TaxID=3144405 RepID=UPI0032E87D1C
MIGPLAASLLLGAASPPLPPMTLDEKAAQLQNEAPASPKLGLAAYDWWSEGLHGIARNGAATVFPQAIGLAATWDPALLEQVGDAVATEARAKWNIGHGRDGAPLFGGLTIWSPNINIFRDPRWGRGQETYGEDPFLTGSLAVGFIRGLQGPDPLHPKTIATAKHFVVHSGPEAGRDSFSVDVSPRDLEQTYLPAFRMAVTEGKARSVMCAYNAIHGTPVCANESLWTGRLRRDWGFTGLTVSDCDAVSNIWLFHHSQPDAAHAAAAALNGGTDLNCGSAYAALPRAVRLGLVSERRIDAALGRAVAMRRALLAPSAWDRIGAEAIDSPAHRALARRAAVESLVLLKNDRAILPLKAQRVAVVGADADDLNILEANYHGTAIDPVTPLAGIRKRFGAVRYAQGSALVDGVPVLLPETALQGDGASGLATTVTRDGKAGATTIARTIDLDFTRTAPFRQQWRGRFVPPAPGRYELLLSGTACWHACPPHDRIALSVGGKLVGGTIGDQPLRLTVDATGPLPIAVDLDHFGGDEGLRLEWRAPADALLNEAEAAARASDVTVAVVGLSPDLEGEALHVEAPGFAGGDRTDVALPAAQRRLLDRLAATGKPLVVVVTAGSAVALGDVRADAILYAWYPGEEGGTAIANVLAGDEDPGGRLPVTIYAATADLPAFVDYGMKERTYRFFTGKPEWAFGHGLSFAQIAIGGATHAARLPVGASLAVEVPLRNAGARKGERVVQAYLVPPASTEAPAMTDPMLQRQLAAFSRRSLGPGEAARIVLAISPRMMSTVDRAGVRRVVPGTYRLWVGDGPPGDGPGQWSEFTLTGAAQELPK